MPNAVTWPTEERCIVGGAEFQTLPVDLFEEGRTTKTTMEGADFLLLKERPLIERYVDVVTKLEPRNVFELGIFHGGSTAFLYELARPRRLVAIDLKPAQSPALGEHIERHGLQDSLRVYDDVDQSDRARLARIVADEFGDEPLDLVIDDCSHLYEPTRASFNEIFPRLRPGGVYFIEDWPWAHPKLGAEENGFYPGEVPLTRLIFETLLALPSMPGLIADITVDRWAASITRGDAEVDPGDFEISESISPRGRELLTPVA